MATNEWNLVDGQSQVSYQVYNTHIVVSEQDDRQYRLIQLGNGIQAMLVHDGKADKAAASLDVAVGHLSDPDDIPGLAHFCEHLLFLGTDLFPKDNAYKEYITQNNGRTNAYTSTTNTNYVFSVATSALPGALERFSAFFYCPLFSPDSTFRTINVVHSEYQLKYHDDDRRIMQLNKHLSSAGHVYSKFGTGTRDTLLVTAKSQRHMVIITPLLSGNGLPARSLSSDIGKSDTEGDPVRETRRRVIEWWSEEYCASRMRLCIIGKESLDELSELAVRFFSPIANRGKDPLPIIDSHPFADEQKGILVFAETVKQLYTLQISFPLEYQPPFWKYKPIEFIKKFVGHEGPGSLHSYLKQKRWITSLCSGPNELATGICIFRIKIELTPEGFSNYRSVVLTVFDYLSLLRSSKFDTFHQEERVRLSDIKFRFLSKNNEHDYAIWIANKLAWPVPRHMHLAAPQRIWAWENDQDRIEGERKIAEYLESFRIENGRVFLMAKMDDHTKLHGDLRWEKEPWYDTGYVVQRWEPEFIERANGVDVPELFLPGPNKFIPSQLNVDKKDGIEAQKRPRLIRQTPMSTLWYKKDDQFWVPKVHVVIDFCSPIASVSARNSVLTRLYSKLVNEALNEYAYDAELAGLSYRLESRNTGLCVSIGGYNDKVSVFVDALLQKIKTLVVDPQRFMVEKESLQRFFSNFFLGRLYVVTDYYTRYLFSKTQWPIEDELKELSTIGPDDVQRYIRDFLTQINLRILVVGNMYKDEAIGIAEMAEHGLGQSPLSADELNERALLLPSGSNFVLRIPVPNPDHADSALQYFTYYGPVADQKLRVGSALMTQILRQPAFDVLRTREQLGYSVHCSIYTLPGSSELGLRIIVVGEKHPGYLEKRVEAFLDEMKVKLEMISDEEFALHQTSLEKKWLEADRRLKEEVKRYSDQVSSGHWDFLRNEKDASLLKVITKADVFDLFMRKVHPSSPTRCKLSVQMVSQKSRPELVSSAAGQAFEVLVRYSFPDIDEKAWRNSVKGETPTLSDFSKYWEKILDTEEGTKVLAQLPSLLREHPVDGEGETTVGGATYIEDLKAFKASLIPAVNPGPLEQWNDPPLPERTHGAAFTNDSSRRTDFVI